MKKLKVDQMENIQGGAPSSGGSRISGQCGVSLGGALVFGSLAVIGGMTGGLGWLAVGMAANYFGWGMAAWTCSV